MNGDSLCVLVNEGLYLVISLVPIVGALPALGALLGRCATVADGQRRDLHGLVFRTNARRTDDEAMAAMPEWDAS